MEKSSLFKYQLQIIQNLVVKHTDLINQCVVNQEKLGSSITSLFKLNIENNVPIEHWSKVFDGLKNLKISEMDLTNPIVDILNLCRLSPDSPLILALAHFNTYCPVLNSSITFVLVVGFVLTGHKVIEAHGGGLQDCEEFEQLLAEVSKAMDSIIG